MANALYITRKDKWSDKTGDAISREEWISYLVIDKEMHFDTTRRPDEDGNEPTHALWKTWPSRKKDERECWMWLEDGNIQCSEADRDIRIKMFLIADGLTARLQGPRGELYNSVGELERKMKSRPTATAAERGVRRPGRARLLLALGSGLILVALGAMTFMS